MVKVKTLVILGSVRPKDSLAPFPSRVATRVGAHLKAVLEDQCEVRVIEPDDPKYALPLMSMPFHWLKALQRPVPLPLQRLVTEIDWAEAYVIVTPEYNFGVGPALLNLLDHIAPANYGGKMALKPCLSVSYSMNKVGGVRALTHLRQVVGELGCVMLSAYLAIPEAHINLTESGEEVPVGPKKEKPIEALTLKAKKELVIVARALNGARQAAADQKSKAKL